MAGRMRRRFRWRAAQAGPSIRLGKMADDGVAASMYALLDRGAGLRPEVALAMRGSVVFHFDEPFAPLSVDFGDDGIVVFDGTIEMPDLSVYGPLPGIIHFATAPNWGGIPSPVRGKGRKALRHFVSGRVRIDGEIGLARSLVRLLSL